MLSGTFMVLKVLLQAVPAGFGLAINQNSYQRESAVADAAKKVGNFADSFFQDGKGSGLKSGNFHNEDTGARKGENEEDIEVDAFIGPPLPQGSAGNMLEAGANALEFGIEFLNKTGLMDKMEESLSGQNKVDGSKQFFKKNHFDNVEQRTENDTTVHRDISSKEPIKSHEELEKRRKN